MVPPYYRKQTLPDKNPPSYMGDVDTERVL